MRAWRRPSFAALLESARRGHEMRREWDAVAKLLELERDSTPAPRSSSPCSSSSRASSKTSSSTTRARPRRTSGCSSFAPDDPTAEEAIERDEAKREKWKELVERYLDEAEQTTDDTFKSSLLMSAGEVAYRYGERNKKALAEIAGRLERRSSSTRRTGAWRALLERIYRGAGELAEGRARARGSRDRRAEQGRARGEPHSPRPRRYAQARRRRRAPSPPTSGCSTSRPATPRR